MGTFYRHEERPHQAWGGRRRADKMRNNDTRILRRAPRKKAREHEGRRCEEGSRGRARAQGRSNRGLEAPEIEVLVLLLHLWQRLAATRVRVGSGGLLSIHSHHRHPLSRDVGVDGGGRASHISLSLSAEP